MLKPLYLNILLAVLTALAPLTAMSQGSIFGTVTNSDMSVPANNALVFFGFTANTDTEIHLSGSIGVGYDGGYWYDDFQNFLNRTPGLPYRYYYFDTVALESAVLSKTIPVESFDRQDVELEPAGWPERPTNFVARRTSANEVTITWDSVGQVTWHLYRRAGSSEGSLFRIDDPLGNLTNPGLTVPRYVDTNPGDEDSYTYVVIAQNPGGQFSPPAGPAEAHMQSCCVGRVGDANQKGDDEPTIADISVMVSHLFIYLQPLPCLAEADVNQSGGLDPQDSDITLGDIMLLVDHLFVSGRELPECLD